MEKMQAKKQIEIRSTVYNVIAEALEQAGFPTEIGCDGRIVNLGEGYFGKLKFSICDATKFSITEEREKVAEKAKEAAERAEKARKKAEEKERKAIERATKAQEKLE